MFKTKSKGDKERKDDKPAKGKGKPAKGTNPFKNALASVKK